MNLTFASLPRTRVAIDAAAAQGPLEWWRPALGQGGINTHPLPERVITGVRKLQPRLIRIFLQECFAFYPERGRFDWSLLDPYMDSFARTGAKIVAAITFKPNALFPTIDETVWQPNDVAEWQQVVSALVQRYSVERPFITYWEIGNEVDIGEDGGCPYLIRDPQAYADYYRLTIAPILKAFPEAKVGGPACASVSNEPLPGLIEYCLQTGTPLDFVSWHLYSSDTRRHVAGIEQVQAQLARFPGKRPEMLITEWNNSFPPVSVEEDAFDPRRAANLAVSLLAMQEAGLDWSFYYHIWDQVFYPDAFRPFFSERGLANMLTHWNEIPHRMGLFGVGEEVRPSYFVYQMLSRLGEERLAASSDETDITVWAGRSEGRIAALLINFNAQTARGQIVTVQFANLDAGRKRLTTYRIDADRRWDTERLELLPVEQREVFVSPAFRCQVYSPADSILLLTLEELR
jgi:hypothetical protein